MNHIFGPVPSRRLGFSLGVDVVPFKTCTLDCVYCQLGKTTNKILERKEYVRADNVLKELKGKLSQEEKKVDYITFSGSGEPTLNRKIGFMINEIKKITSIPVAVLTNGTLLYDFEVREDLSRADLVIPSLDAPDEDTFRRINKPHPSLTLEKIISGVSLFSQEYPGHIWLEIMLVKGMNDSPGQIKQFARIVERINPDKIQLNTPLRPPAEDFVQPVSLSSLRKAQRILGETCEIIAGFKDSEQRAHRGDVEDTMLTMMRRRPVSLKDLSQSLGLHRNEVAKYLRALDEKNLISSQLYGKERYYYARN